MPRLTRAQQGPAEVRRSMLIAVVLSVLSGAILPLVVLFVANGAVAGDLQRAKELTSVAWLLLVVGWIISVAFALLVFLL